MSDFVRESNFISFFYWWPGSEIFNNPDLPLVLRSSQNEAGTFDFIWVEDGGQEYTASKKLKLV